VNAHTRAGWTGLRPKERIVKTFSRLFVLLIGFGKCSIRLTNFFVAERFMWWKAASEWCRVVRRRDVPSDLIGIFAHHVFYFAYITLFGDRGIGPSLSNNFSKSPWIGGWKDKTVFGSSFFPYIIEDTGCQGISKMRLMDWYDKIVSVLFIFLFFLSWKDTIHLLDHAGMFQFEFIPFCPK
jgi:hypothetical protein